MFRWLKACQGKLHVSSGEVPSWITPGERYLDTEAVSQTSAQADHAINNRQATFRWMSSGQFLNPLRRGRGQTTCPGSRLHDHLIRSADAYHRLHWGSDRLIGLPGFSEQYVCPPNSSFWLTWRQLLRPAWRENRSIFFESRRRDVRRAGRLMRQEVPTLSADGPAQLLSGFGRCCSWSMALYHDTCELIPSPPLTAFLRRLY